MSVNPAEPVNLVIIGVSFSARGLLETLNKKFKKFPKNLQVTLIDRRDYFEGSTCSPRYLVDPPLFDIVTKHIKDMYPSFNFIHGKADSVLPGNLVRVFRYQDGRLSDVAEEIPYDYLVVSTGSQYKVFKGFHETLAQRREEVHQFSQKVRNAQHILIAGGGSVAVELVGEVIDMYPKKQITIVHSGKSLLAGKYSVPFLKARGVNIVSDTKLVLDDVREPDNIIQLNNANEPLPMQVYRTDKGQEIQADLLFNCTGYRMPESVFQQHFPDSLTATHEIKVQPSLKVVGFENVFALGDAIHAPGTAKIAANLPKQVNAVADNIIASIKGKKATARFIKAMPTPGLVTIGRTYGILMAMPVFGYVPHGAHWSKLKTGFFEKSAPKSPEFPV
eukprot:TRINITY_DN21_c0_g1_i1.p1 TRINITY_DN21_c0_g1~~TRINITY_DN21_c0_g1_i1.p1  ORF type:complete len:390 (+),score=69.16 TRINITY_DN21_c0_g1_i1:281-1450(+)